MERKHYATHTSLSVPCTHRVISPRAMLGSTLGMGEKKKKRVDHMTVGMLEMCTWGQKGKRLQWITSAPRCWALHQGKSPRREEPDVDLKGCLKYAGCSGSSFGLVQQADSSPAAPVPWSDIKGPLVCFLSPATPQFPRNHHPSGG